MENLHGGNERRFSRGVRLADEKFDFRLPFVGLRRVVRFGVEPAMLAIVELVDFVRFVVVRVGIVGFGVYTAAFGFLLVHVLVVDRFFGPTDTRTCARCWTMQLEYQCG